MCCLLLTACSADRAPEAVNTAVDSPAALEYAGKSFDCHITYVSDRLSSVTLLSPESVQGLKYARADGQTSLSLGSLLCRSGHPLPGGQALSEQLFSMMDAAARNGLSLTDEKDGRYTFTGQSGGKDFTVVTDCTGKLLEMKNEALAVIFQDT